MLVRRGGGGGAHFRQENTRLPKRNKFGRLATRGPEEDDGSFRTPRGTDSKRLFVPLGPTSRKGEPMKRLIYDIGSKDSQNWAIAAKSCEYMVPGSRGRGRGDQAARRHKDILQFDVRHKARGFGAEDRQQGGGGPTTDSTTATTVWKEFKTKLVERVAPFAPDHGYAGRVVARTPRLSFYRWSTSVLGMQFQRCCLGVLLDTHILLCFLSPSASFSALTLLFCSSRSSIFLRFSPSHLSLLVGFLFLFHAVSLVISCSRRIRG